MIGFWLILGGCGVALIWWAVRKSQRQSQQGYAPTTTLGYTLAVVRALVGDDPT